MKKLIIGIIIALFLLLIIAISIPFFVDLNKYKGIVVSQIEKAIHREVKVDKIKLSLLKGLGVNLDNIIISNNPEFKKEPFLILEGLEVKLKILPLLRKRIEVKKIILNSPKLLIEINKEGKFNFNDLVNPQKTSSQIYKKDSSPILFVSQEKKSPPLNPFLKNLNISRISINKGDVKFIDDYSDAKKERVTHIEGLNLKATNISLSTPLDFKLSAKILTQKEQKIDIQGKIGPFGDRLDFKKVDLNLVMKLTDLDIAHFYPYYKKYSPLIIHNGFLNSDVRLSGNLNEKFSSDGKISLRDFSFKDKKGFLKIDKKINLDVERKITIDFKKDLLTLDNFDISLLDNHLNVSGDIKEFKKNPRVNLNLSSKKLLLSQIEGLYPPIKKAMPKGMTVKGPLSFLTDVQGTRTNFTLKGDLNLDKSRLVLKDILNKPEKMNTRILYDFSFGDDQLTIKSASLNLKDLNLKSSGTIKKFDNPLVDLKIKTSELNLKGWEDILLVGKGGKLSGLLAIDLGLKGPIKDPSKIYFEGKIRARDIEPLEDIVDLFSPTKDGTKMLTMKGKASIDSFIKGEMNDLITDTRIDLDQAGIKYAGLIEKPMGTPANLLFNGSFAKNNIRVKKLNLNLKNLNIKGSGTIINTKQPKIDLNLSTNEIDFIQLKELIPPLKEQKLSGRIKTDIKIKGDMALMKDIDLQGNLSMEKVGAKFSFIPKEIHDMSGKISMQGKRMDIKGLTMGYGNTIVNLDASIKDFDSPKIKFSLRSPRLDFDDLLFAGQPKKADRKIYGESILPVAKKIENKDSFLKKIQAEGDIRIERGGYKNFNFSDLKADLFFGKMALTIRPLSFNLYKGFFSGSALMDFKEGKPIFYVQSNLRKIDVKELINSNTSLKDMINGTLNSDLSISGRMADAVTITKSLDGKGEFAVTNGEIKMALLRDLLNQLPLQQLSLISPDFRRLYSCLEDYSKLEKTRFQYLALPLNIKNGVVYVPRYQILSSDLLDVVTDKSGGKINLNTMDVDFKNVMAVLTKPATDHCFGPKAQKYIVNEQGRAVIPFQWRGHIKEGSFPKPIPDTGAILARAARGGIIDTLDRLIDKKKTTPETTKEKPQEPLKPKEQLEELGKELLRELLK